MSFLNDAGRNGHAAGWQYVPGDFIKHCIGRSLPYAHCLNAFPHPIEQVGFEVGALSQHLFYGLQSQGFDGVCMEARQVSAALSAMQNRSPRYRSDPENGLVQPDSYERVIASEIEGEAELEYHPEKLIYRLAVPLTHEGRGPK